MASDNTTEMGRSFHRFNSAEVDWCEENYVVTPVIVEFFNTISNAPFLIYSPTLAVLFRNYARMIGYGCYFVFFLLFVVGAGSTYFHSTLSVIGQLVDQVSILWVLLAGIGLWYPKRHMPKMFNASRARFQFMIILPVSLTLTGLSLILPKVNAFFLMFLAAPVITMLILEYRRHTNWKIRSLSIRAAVCWFLAVTVWVNDKFLCEIFWNDFPYLHALWHVLIAITALKACVLFSYFQVTQEHPEYIVSLRYWPLEGGYWDLISIPYVHLAPKRVMLHSLSHTSVTSSDHGVPRHDVPRHAVRHTINQSNTLYKTVT